MSRSFQERLARWLYEGVPVGRIKGIAISVHSVLILIILFQLLMPRGGSTGLILAEVAVMFAVLFGSVLLHELGHCWGAHLVGGRAESVLLWPLGGLATISGADRSPSDEFVVVILGPAVSLALAIVGTIAWWLIPGSLAAAGAVGWTATLAIYYLMWLNWMLFIFNMVVPLFPMDCARLVRSLCSMKYNPQKVTYNLCLSGFFVAGAMAALGVVTFFGFRQSVGEPGVIFLLIALFGVQCCRIEMKRIEYEYVYKTGEFGDRENRIGDIFNRLTTKLKAKRKAPARVRLLRRPAEIVEASASPEPSERQALLAELDEAVGKEDFMRAAEIRDKLKSLQTESQKS